MSDNHTGAMIAFLPEFPDGLVVPEGDAASELHVTMLYLGDDHTQYTAQDRHQISSVLNAVALGPITATVTGVQTLGDSEPPATVLMLEAPALQELRPRLKLDLLAAGVPVPEDTYPSYLPHLTLGYGLNPDDYQTAVGMDIPLDRVGVWYGPDRAEIELKEDTKMGDRFYAVIARMGVPTGDRRIIAPGAISYRDLPRALQWQEFAAPGHDGAVVIGRIDSIATDEMGVVTAYGELLDESIIPEVARAKELIRNGVLGCSIDPGMVEAEETMDGWTLFTRYEIGAFTALPIAAFANTPIMLIDQTPVPDMVEEEYDCLISYPEDSGPGNEYGYVITLTAAVTSDGMSELPVAPLDHGWDGAAAADRVMDWATDDGVTDWEKYGRAFLLRDDKSVTASAMLTSFENLNSPAPAAVGDKHMQAAMDTETPATSPTATSTTNPRRDSAKTAQSQYGPQSQETGHHGDAPAVAHSTTSGSIGHAPTPPIFASAAEPSNSSIDSTTNSAASAPFANPASNSGHQTAPEEAHTSTTTTEQGRLVRSSAGHATWVSDASATMRHFSAAQPTTLTASAADPTRADFKLGVADVVDGELTLIPRAVYAVAGVLSGARGGVDATTEEVDRLKGAVRSLYERIADQSGEDVEAPFALTAAAGRFPPKAAFDNPGFTTYTPLGITEVDGWRVLSGHIAPLDVPHRGLSGNVYAPRSKSGYREFLLGGTMTAEGIIVPTGPVTIGGGHAATHLNAQAAVEHYDDAGTRAASVAVGEDNFGIWISGVIKDGVADADAYSLLEFPPSGDWRADQFGNLELILIHQVNTPGFPVYRVNQDMASGNVYALVASAAAWKADAAPEFSIDLNGDLEAQFEAAGVPWPTISGTYGGKTYGEFRVAPDCVRGMLAQYDGPEFTFITDPAERARAFARLRLILAGGN